MFTQYHMINNKSKVRNYVIFTLIIDLTLWLVVHFSGISCPYARHKQNKHEIKKRNNNLILIVVLKFRAYLLTVQSDTKI